MNENNPVKVILEAKTNKQVLPYETVEVREKWVADALKDDLKSWNCAGMNIPQPVLINAPTGAGKSTFVLNDLASHVAEEKQYVLLLSNRSALELQQKYALCRIGGAPQVGAEVLSDMHVFGNVIVLTYQSVLGQLGANGMLQKYPIGMVVFDEAHFFCSDSAFNAWTEQILTTLLARYWNCKRIYMSATPKDVKELIAYEEWKLISTSRANPTNPKYLAALCAPAAIKEYCFPEDYSYIQLHFFYEWEDIESLIEEDASTNKWLIFVDSKEQGKKLKSELGNKSNFIDATYKERKSREFADLVRREMYESKVLITTSALDNGINFHDSTLKSVVIESMDEIQVKQMLGRKRIDGEENIDLYVMLKTKEDLLDRRKIVLEQYELLQEFFQYGDVCIQQRWGSLTESQQLLFDVGEVMLPWNGYNMKTIRFVSSSYTAFQLARMMGRLDAMGDRFTREGDGAFANEVCEWFGIAYESKMNIGESSFEKAKQEVEQVIIRYVQESPLDEAKVKMLDAAL